MSRANAIDHILLRSYPDKYSPPSEPMLRIALVGDAAYLTIVKHHETNTTVTEDEISHFTVDANALIDGLMILARDVVLSEKREPM